MAEIEKSMILLFASYTFSTRIHSPGPYLYMIYTNLVGLFVKKNCYDEIDQQL